jgi:hypothetical protein
MRHMNEGDHLIGSRRCFLCELDCEPGHVTDTFREFDPDWQHPLAGPKYVCDTCALQLGEAVGMVPSDQVKEALQATEDARNQIRDAHKQMTAFGKSLGATVGSLNLPTLAVVTEQGGH